MIELKSVSFSYDGKTKVLEDINLHIREGECVLLCGRSGCGKSTLTRLLNGIIPNCMDGTAHGEISIAGIDPLNSPMYEIAKRVGSVFQNPRTQFYTVNTTSEIAFGCENMGMKRNDIIHRIASTAHDLGIESLLDRSIFQLSGGEKQKIAFASVYALSPQVYVLDEPSSNLDAGSVNDIRRILQLLKKQGKTIVIAEHRNYYLNDIADRAIYIENGRITAEYSMEDLAVLPEEERMHTGIRLAQEPKINLRGFDSVSNNALYMKGISFSYDRKHPALAISELSLKAGQIYAITGKNGAGKSTFVSCLCGLKKRIRGQYLLDRRGIGTRERVKLSYMVMQEVNHQLFSDSVREEISLGAEQTDEKNVKQIMQQLDISYLADRHPLTLSGGQKQRVAIAAAMFCDKRIVILDEPTSGLDYFHMMQTAKLIEQLKNSNTFMFIISHDFEFISAVCDNEICFENGKVCSTISPMHS